jgi:hypothetical protein
MHKRKERRQGDELALARDIAGAAQRLGPGTGSVRRLLHAGLLHGIKSGRRTLTLDAMRPDDLIPIVRQALQATIARLQHRSVGGAACGGRAVVRGGDALRDAAGGHTVALAPGVVPGVERNPRLWTDRLSYRVYEDVEDGAGMEAAQPVPAGWRITPEQEVR